MTRELWVAGFPSRYGGADTELDHQIDLWRAHGVDVHLVPMFGADEEMLESVQARGCRIHDYRDDVFKDRLVVSYCNGPFLERLPAIAAAGRPQCTIWFNCMTWMFEAEKEAHAKGLIDRFGFVSAYQRQMLLPELERIAPVHEVEYRPYFASDRFEWRYREWDGCYRVGRISRDDGAKFALDTWRIFDRVLTPAHLKKKVYILGFGPNAERTIGSAPPSLDWRTWAGNELSATDFFRTIDTMIHKTGGSRESYCRVLVEAYAHGVVPIVENDYAFPDLVIHGETGFLTSDSEEMSYFASWLAMNPAEHRRIAENGRSHLERVLSKPDACWRCWDDLFRSLEVGSSREEPAHPGSLEDGTCAGGPSVDSPPSAQPFREDHRARLPSVSCICLTYGRIECLQEAIQFFLSQDYEGAKELIVVNDLPQQEIVFDHPEVRIFNLRQRFDNLGAKRNFAIGHSRGDVILTWDDDDGYLCHHITQSVRLIEGYDYAKPDKCFVWVGDDEIERIAGSFMSQIVFTRELFERVGGYGSRSYGEDMELSARMLSTPGIRTNFAHIEVRDITFLFRWSNGEYHLSGYGEGCADRTGYDRVADDVSDHIGAGRVRVGTIQLVPSIRWDCATAVSSFLARRAPVADCPALLLRHETDVVPIQLFDEDLAPPWSVSMWIRKQPNTLSAPIALFDSEKHSIRLAQFGALEKFGVTRYHHRDYIFDFRPELAELTNVILIARLDDIALFVDGHLLDTLPTAISFPSRVADTRSLLEYRVFRGALSCEQIRILAKHPPPIHLDGSNKAVKHGTKRSAAPIRLKFITNWIGNTDFIPYLAKMCKANFSWNQLKMVEHNEDYTVVINHPGRELGLDPARTIHLHMEPECVRRGWGRWHAPDESTASIVLRERNALEWHLSQDYRALLGTRPEKSRILSAVVSDLCAMEGHRLRLAFVRDHLSALPYFDHFGRGNHQNASFRGYLPRKEDGLFPYMYTFAAENCAEAGYFSEKLADAILSECLTFYWGCTNLETWIHPGCFVRVDLRDPDRALAVVKQTVEEGAWARRIGLIRKEKFRILNELQIFPTLERIIAARVAPPMAPV